MRNNKTSTIRRSSILFLQSVISLIGIVALALMLIMPHFEGRNINANFFQVYFNDPFLIYIYLTSIPFFLALFQSLKLLNLIGHNKVLSQAAVSSLKTIKYCAFITATAIVTAIIYLNVVSITNSEDAAGAIMLGNILTLASIVVCISAAVFEKTLQSAVDIKSENDLTV